MLIRRKQPRLSFLAVAAVIRDKTKSRSPADPASII